MNDTGRPVTPRDWYHQNRGRRVKRPKGRIVYVVDRLNKVGGRASRYYPRPFEIWQFTLRREDTGKMVKCSWGDVRRMIDANT